MVSADWYQMAPSPSYVEFIREQLSGLGPVTVRRMFGGAGVYAEGVMFGLIIWDTLFLKCDQAGRPAFEEEGMEPFSYATKGGRNTINSFWRCPERLFDEPDEMLVWARRAMASAHDARKPRSRPTTVAKRRKSPRKPS